MRKRSYFAALSLAMGLFAASEVNADVNSSTQNNSYMVPAGRLILAPDDFADDMGVSSLFEGGPRTARIGGTIGYQLNPWNRLKFSGEYLAQKLEYSFSTGNRSKWVRQAAFGLDFETFVDKDCLRAIDFSLYTSYAPSKRLSTEVLPNSSRIDRRIAGSTAWGAAIGSVWTIGCDDLFNVAIDWDHVRYRRKFSHAKTVSGIGLDVAYTHRFPCCVDFTLEGQFRRPFNYLGGKLNWNSAFDNPQVNIALFGGHTRGKIKLPSSSIVGIELSYALAVCQPRPRDCCPPLWNPCDIVAWSMVPAVYMPEVLAIAEERVRCNGPTSTAIPRQFYETFTVGTYPVGSYFSTPEGTLTYSISNPGVPGAVISISSAGVISLYTQSLDPIDVVVTATNGCGTTSQVIEFRTAD